MAAVSKDMMRQVLDDAFRTDENVPAFWSDGSLAMGRADDGPDVDLQVLTRDGYAKTAQSVIANALRSLGTIDITSNLPEPIWHGHLQVFYRRAEANPVCLVDLLIVEGKSPVRGVKAGPRPASRKHTGGRGSLGVPAVIGHEDHCGTGTVSQHLHARSRSMCMLSRL